LTVLVTSVLQCVWFPPPPMIACRRPKSLPCPVSYDTDAPPLWRPVSSPRGTPQFLFRYVHYCFTGLSQFPLRFQHVPVFRAILQTVRKFPRDALQRFLVPPPLSVMEQAFTTPGKLLHDFPLSGALSCLEPSIRLFP